MFEHDSNQRTFLELVKSGLWEKEARLLPYEPIDFNAVYKIAEDQSVVGIVAAGLEHVSDRKIAKQEALPFLKRVVSLENRNAAMNSFIAMMVNKLRNAGVNTILVKGQGVAQCYSRPEWRVSGDVDFFLDDKNYELAKSILVPLADSSEYEGKYTHHLGLNFNSWLLELHGTLRCGLSHRIDKVIDEVQKDTFVNRHVRTWNNDGTDVLLPGVDNDIIFVFTHFIKHFYKGGVGFRQICDWCRLIWTYRSVIDIDLLEKRLHSMRLLNEWKAFGSFAVEYLGLPKETMPLYSNDKKWKQTAYMISTFIFDVGNMGIKRDNSYLSQKPYIIRKIISFNRRCEDLSLHARLFPLNSIRFFPFMFFNGIRSAIYGEG